MNALSRPRTVAPVIAPPLKLTRVPCLKVLFDSQRPEKVPYPYRDHLPVISFQIFRVKASDEGVGILAKPLFDNRSLSLFVWKSRDIHSLNWLAYGLDESLLGPAWSDTTCNKHLLALLENSPFDLS